MARRFTRGRALPVKKIHTLRWESIQGASLGQAAGSVAIGAVLGAGSPAETILRLRGWVMTQFDGAKAPGVLVLVSMGMILVPEGQGSTVIWDPFNDPNAPWLWFTEVTLGYDEAVTDTIAYGNTHQAVEIDGKAMRKGSPDEELQLVITNTTLQVASSVTTSLTARALLGH